VKKASPAIPEAHSGLPRGIERHLLAPYAEGWMRRALAAGMMRAFGRLLTRHPRVALDVTAAGAAQTTRVLWRDLREKTLSLMRFPAPETAQPAHDRTEVEATAEDLSKRLGKREIRALRKMLGRAERAQRK
jgi:hypothetical protein